MKKIYEPKMAPIDRKIARIRAGKTQADVMAETGLPQQVISYLETGYSKTSAENTEKYEKYLNGLKSVK